MIFIILGLLLGWLIAKVLRAIRGRAFSYMEAVGVCALLILVSIMVFLPFGLTAQEAGIFAAPTCIVAFYALRWKAKEN